jgi:hypothetical protein
MAQSVAQTDMIISEQWISKEMKATDQPCHNSDGKSPAPYRGAQVLSKARSCRIYGG